MNPISSSRRDLLQRSITRSPFRPLAHSLSWLLLARLSLPLTSSGLGGRSINPIRPMNPKNTAVVLIEFQNDFTTKGGKLHDAVKPVMESTGMLENTVATVDEARKAGATIVHVPIHFAPDFREISNSPYGILKGCKDGETFQKGTWGAEIVDALKPEASDIVVEGKRGLDGFATTNLDFILRSRKIENVAIAGFLTNCCVESTMRTAYELGYNVVTLKDCAATVSEEAHQNAIEHDFPMFSHPLTHEEFLADLAGKKVAAATT